MAYARKCRPGRSIVVALVAAAALCACTAEDTWTQAQARHTTKVTLTREMHAVAFAGNNVQASGGELDRVAALVRGEGARQPAQILYVPDPGRSLAPRRASELQRALQGRGIAVAPPALLDPGMAAPGTVFVAATRYVATPPSCPDWSKRSETDHDNLPPSNFGCATERNLGVMLADPADLVRGRDHAGQDGDASTLGIQRYRAGKTTPLQAPNTQSSGETSTK